MSPLRIGVRIVAGHQADPLVIVDERGQPREVAFGHLPPQDAPIEQIHRHAVFVYRAIVQVTKATVKGKVSPGRVEQDQIAGFHALGDERRCVVLLFLLKVEVVLPQRKALITSSIVSMEQK